MKFIHRCSKWFIVLSAFVGPPATPQSLTIEPPHTSVCWVVRIPDHWDFTPADLRLYQNVTNAEFRSKPTADDGILVRVWLFGSPPAATVYSKNAYWISTMGKGRPRLATDEEWDKAQRLREQLTPPKGCTSDENGATCGDKRFDRTHTIPRVGEIGHKVYQSHDGRWLVLDTWDGKTLFQKKGFGILGNFPDSGGVGGARGHQYVDIFEFATGRRIATAGGNFDGWPSARFSPLLWFPPYYLVGVLDKAQRKLLFCNPALAEKSE
jgi:hypothetical protein